MPEFIREHFPGLPPESFTWTLLRSFLRGFVKAFQTYEWSVLFKSHWAYAQEDLEKRAVVTLEGFFLDFLEFILKEICPKMQAYSRRDSLIHLELMLELISQITSGLWTGSLTWSTLGLYSIWVIKAFQAICRGFLYRCAYGWVNWSIHFLLIPGEFHLDHLELMLKLIRKSTPDLRPQRRVWTALGLCPWWFVKVGLLQAGAQRVSLNYVELIFQVIRQSTSGFWLKSFIW